MKKQLAILFVGLGIAQSTLLAAEMQNDEKKTQPCFLPGDPLDGRVVPSGYPIPDHAFRQRKMSVYADAYFLYWHAYNIQAQVGNKNNLTHTRTSRLNMSTGYRPGVRVGIGADIGPVVLDAVYTRYRHTFSNHFSGNDEGTTTVTPAPAILGVQLDGVGDFQHLSNQYIFHFDELTLTGQKEVYVRPKMLIKAAFGLDSIVQRQTFLTRTSTPGVSTGLVRATHRFWGVGPFLGMRLRGIMSFGFRVIGNLEFALQYLRLTKGEFELKFPQDPDPLANNRQIYARPIANFMPKQEAALGLGWEKRFNNDVRINVSATYNWIGMWIFGPSLWETRLLGGGYMHGLQLGGQVDF